MKIEITASMNFCRTKDKDLLQHYSPISLLLSSVDQELKEFEESLTLGKKYKITIEEIK